MKITPIRALLIGVVLYLLSLIDLIGSLGYLGEAFLVIFELSGAGLVLYGLVGLLFSGFKTKSEKKNIDKQLSNPLSPDEIQLQNTLHKLVSVSYGAEEKYKTVTKNLPDELIKTRDLLFDKVVRTLDQVFGTSLSAKDKHVLGPTFKFATMLGLCVFDVRTRFSKQFPDNDMKGIDLHELRYAKLNNPTSEEIFKLVDESMDHEGKDDIFENTPPYVISYLSLEALKIFSGLEKTKLLKKFNEKQNELILSSIAYLLSSSYFCGIAYIYLANIPANNMFQDYVKKT